MGKVYITLSDPIPDLECSNCGKEHQYDPMAGWGCMVLTDESSAPASILGIWCDQECLNQWLDTHDAKLLLAPGL